MQRVALDSEAIASAGYDDVRSMLEIEFTTGAVYRYYSVPPSVYEGLLSAASHGRCFAATIRGRYRYKKQAATADVATRSGRRARLAP